MFVAMEVDSEFSSFEHKTNEWDEPDKCESLIRETFPDVKSYYSYILYNTTRLFPAYPRPVSLSRNLLMIEAAKTSPDPVVLSKKSFGMVNKRKCQLESVPVKYIKCSF